MSKKSFLYSFLALCLVCVCSSCYEKESNIGLELQDPSTIYRGIVDTAYGTAYTVYDDTLKTSGLSTAIIGGCTESHFGSSLATLFSNISTYNGGSASFDEHCSFDSVVLSLAITGIFVDTPDSSSTENLHFTIRQLSQRLSKDSAYKSNSEVEVSNTVFYDGVVNVQRSDSMFVRLKLSDAFVALIANHSYASAEEFEEEIKGMHISLQSDDVTKRFVTINLSASATRLTAYFQYENNGTMVPRTYDFDFGTNITHFSHFERTFTGSLATFNTNHGDSVRGSGELFLSPLGGTNIRFSIDSFVRQFHQDHPMAIIHYAELILPVNANSPAERPERIVAYKIEDNGKVPYIPDMLDAFTNSGFDGKYNTEGGYYRLRITQHLQDLVRAGRDNGTLLVIDGRRTSCEHAIINGDDSSNPIRVKFVYSE